MPSRNLPTRNLSIITAIMTLGVDNERMRGTIVYLYSYCSSISQPTIHLFDSSSDLPSIIDRYSYQLNSLLSIHNCEVQDIKVIYQHYY